MSSCLLLISIYIYSGMLHVYPAEFRRQFGSEMMQVFRDECRASVAVGNPVVLIAFWLHIICDLVITASRERLAITDRRSFAFLLPAISLGVWIGLVDYRSDEVQNAVLLIVLSTFLFGLFLPRSSWLRAVVIGLGVPVIHYIAMWIGLKPPYPVSPGIYASFLALIPAFVGNAIGVLARWAIATAVRA